MERNFVIPDKLKIIQKSVITLIIQSIPDEWFILRGILRAPQHMLNSGEASSTTHLVFGSSIDQMITNDGEGQADIFGVLIEGKKPKSIEFGTGFDCCEVMPMIQSKLTTVHFVDLKYNGRLTFRYSDPEDRADKPTECEIWIPPFRTMALDNDPKATFKIRSEDDPYYLRMIDPVTKMCEGLLTEVTE